MVTPQEKMEGFEIVDLGDKVAQKEMSELIAIVENSLRDEIIFQLRVSGLSTAERTAWIRRFWLQAPIEDPKQRVLAIRDSRSGVLVAYTGLQIPYIQSDAEATEQKKISEGMANALKPQAKDFFLSFRTKVASVPAKYGYDPSKHFHKRNTLMLPEYHRRGLGTWLTRYCNDLADQVGQPTYVIGRPKAWKMLEVTGFELLQTIEFDTREYGSAEAAVLKIYKRSPKAA